MSPPRLIAVRLWLPTRGMSMKEKRFEERGHRVGVGAHGWLPDMRQPGVGEAVSAMATVHRGGSSKKVRTAGAARRSSCG